MCIAIYKPKDVILTKGLLKTCFKNNENGAGFAFPSKDQKKVIIEKGFFSFREFWIRYRIISKLNRPMLIHFRVATSGKIDGENCHPWKITPAHAMVHNGVLQYKLGLESKECSDSGQFVEFILKPTFEKNTKIWRNPAYKWAIQQSIGTNNKIIILDSKGRVVIFNEKEGEWHGEGEKKAWFSNQTYKNARKSYLSVGDSWIEKMPGGQRRMAVRRNGRISYNYVTSPLESEFNSKIMKFAEKQTGTKLSPIMKPLPLPLPYGGTDAGTDATEIFDEKEVDPTMLI